MNSKRIKTGAAIIIVFLLIPFVAMQFTDEVNWSVVDFIVAAVLLSGAAWTINLILNKIKKSVTRIILVAAVLFVLALVWAELAVGIFGTPFAGS